MMKIVIIFIWGTILLSNVRAADSDAEVVTLLKRAKSLDLSLQDRSSAIEKLANFRHPAIVPTLLNLLPGDGDIGSFEIIRTLRKIGDLRVLPKFEEILHDKNNQIPDKVNTILIHAINELREKEKCEKSNASSKSR